VESYVAFYPNPDIFNKIEVLSMSDVSKCGADSASYFNFSTAEIEI